MVTPEFRRSSSVRYACKVVFKSARIAATNNETIKTSIIVIVLAATALASVDALKCQKYASGSLASWEEVNLENGHVQRYVMKVGKLAKKGEEFDFYTCEAPAKFRYNLWANRDLGAEKAGVIETKDGKKCLTNSFIRERDPSQDEPYHTGYKQVPEKVEKKVTLEDCAEGGMELRKQWFTLKGPLRKGCSRWLLLHGHKSDNILDLTYGPEGVAFDEADGLGPKKTEDGHHLTSHSYFMTGRLDATCVNVSP